MGHYVYAVVNYKKKHFSGFKNLNTVIFLLCNVPDQH